MWAGVPRDLDLAEIFSGKGTLAFAAREQKLAAVTFDIVDSPAEDILSSAPSRRSGS